ncbi:MAG: hypothetical protein ACNI27_06990 [Desulfovibrio sp.]
MSRAAVGTGAGKGRQPWNIRAYLDSKGMKMADVARSLDVSHQAVAQTVGGVRNHRKVLLFLYELGCPEDDLSLPQKIKDEL